MKKYIKYVIIILIIILLSVFIKNKIDNINIKQYDRIKILEEDLQRERNIRAGMYNELLEVQKEVFKEEIKKADELIRKNYDLNGYTTDFYGIDENGFLQIEYWNNNYSGHYKVNLKTSTILITNK